MSEHRALIVVSRSSHSLAEAESSKDVVNGQIDSPSDHFPQSPRAVDVIEVPKPFIGMEIMEQEDISVKGNNMRASDHKNGKHEMHESRIVECRICQEEDQITNLESPCACSGSLKFAHRKCVQNWCNEKGDIICEICQKPFEDGYTLPHPDGQHTSIHVGHMGEPQIFAISMDHQILEGEYPSDYARSAACLWSVALILMVLLLLQQLLSMGAADVDDDTSTVVLLFILRAAGLLLPFYIMARAFNALLYRHQREVMSCHCGMFRPILQCFVYGRLILGDLLSRK